MKIRTFRILTVAVGVLLLAGCTDDAVTNGSAVESDGMPGMQEPAQDGAEHVAEGTVNSVDAASDTVNISHEPVESIGWPAMTMNFQLSDPDLATQLTPGQRVEFRFRTDQGSATVTEIRALDQTN